MLLAKLRVLTPSFMPASVGAPERLAGRYSTSGKLVRTRHAHRARKDMHYDAAGHACVQLCDACLFCFNRGLAFRRWRDGAGAASTASSSLAPRALARAAAHMPASAWAKRAARAAMSASASTGTGLPWRSRIGRETETQLDSAACRVPPDRSRVATGPRFDSAQNPYPGPGPGPN